MTSRREISQVQCMPQAFGTAHAIAQPLQTAPVLRDVSTTLSSVSQIQYHGTYHLQQLYCSSVVHRALGQRERHAVTASDTH